ncbi:energy-coupling factor transporter ATP-binding protein EcfA1 [Clostridia bacterium]|nr:energy-coupling factor transporter ATP-binding protein EcfA1 [Clostridia bacterium]
MIVFDKVTFSYREGAEPALRDVSLEIGEGSFVAVLGHNGSGKSTLAKMINGVLIPTSGKVTMLGLDTAVEDNLLKIRQNAAMVFQNPDNQIVAAVVEEDVAFALENLGVPSDEIRRRVDKALRDVNMYEFREHAPHRLSGGQKQRVAIAGVLAMRPRCIVFDEPTAMLDPVGRREVLDTLNDLRARYGITCVLVTHHMDEAARADRAIVMNRGAIAMDGTPAEIFASDRLYDLGLKPPPTVALLTELARRGLNVQKDIMTVDECALAVVQSIG